MATGTINNPWRVATKEESYPNSAITLTETFRFTRVGNIVFCNYTGNITLDSNTINQYNTIGEVPAGYRPRANDWQEKTGNTYVSAAVKGAGRWRVMNTPYKIYFNGDTTGAQTLYCSLVWYTDEPFPTT